MKAHFEMMAAYNGWANRLLYGAAHALPDADYRRDLGAAFGSIHGTLNHLIVADVIWLSRLQGQPPPPWRLDHIPHDDPEALHLRRVALDREIMELVGGLDQTRLAGVLEYATATDGSRQRQPVGDVLAHFFNHQTHHRGQCHAMLTRLTGQAPALDLVYFQRAQQAAG